jgi:hypothetical protein
MGVALMLTAANTRARGIEPQARAFGQSQLWEDAGRLAEERHARKEFILAVAVALADRHHLLASGKTGSSISTVTIRIAEAEIADQVEEVVDRFEHRLGDE